MPVCYSLRLFATNEHSSKYLKINTSNFRIFKYLNFLSVHFHWFNGPPLGYLESHFNARKPNAAGFYIKCILVNKDMKSPFLFLNRASDCYISCTAERCKTDVNIFSIKI